LSCPRHSRKLFFSDGTKEQGHLVSEPAPARFDNVAARIVPWLAVLLYTLCCLSVWTESEWRPEWDSAVYLLVGKSLAAGEGYHYLDQPFFLRPPGFPWMLSLLAGDGEYNFEMVNRAIMLFAGTAVAAIFLAFRESMGTWNSMGVALVSGTSVVFVGNFNWVASDFPFATFFFLAMWLLDRSSRKASRWWIAAVAGALALAAALYLRTVGILLLPALLVQGVLIERGRARWRCAVPLLLVAALMFPWWIHSRAGASSAERPAEQLMAFDYVTTMWHVDPGDPDSPLIPVAGWFARIFANGDGLIGDLSLLTLHTKSTWGMTLATVILLAGWGRALYTKVSFRELFAGLYVLLLLSYFEYASRLAVPLVPFVYVYAVQSVIWLAERLAPSKLGRRTQAVSAVVITLLIAANLPGLLKRPPSQDYGYGKMARWFRENTDEDAVILCRQAPIVHLLSGRRAYTYRFPRSADLLAKYEADYVILSRRTPPIVAQQTAERATRAWNVARRQVVRVRAEDHR